MPRPSIRVQPSQPQTTTIRVAGRDLPLVIRYHRRARRMILRLAADGEAAVVTLPPFATERDGLSLAMRSTHWLATRLARLPARVPFADGTELPLLGQPHRIVFAPTARGISAADGTIAVGGTAENAPHRLNRWLRHRARHEIAPRCGEKAARIGRTLGRISVRDPTSRWGSCSATGNLSFSWRLVMAPAGVLDYVVAHEVAHLAERGHGAAFWAIVRTLIEDVDEARAWLRCHGASLHRYG